MRLGEKILERYKILDRLGQGRSGTVYLCKDQTNSSMVAIQEVCGAPRFPDLRQEVAILRGLSHASLAKVFDYFEVGDSSFLVMEYLEGSTLVEEVTDVGPMGEQDVLATLRTVFEVLDYLHRQAPPVFCRDLRPSHLIRHSSGQVMLTNVGLSKAVDGGLAASGTVACIPGYSPPEHYTGQTDALSDIYSVGATCYYLLSGVVPSPSIDLVLGKGHLSPLLELCPTLTNATAQAIERMMSLNRTQRPETVWQAATLAGLGTGFSSAAEHATSAGAGAPHSPPPSARSLLSSGDVVHGQYAIERVLGQGGMGAVYLASHLALGESVAIKEMRQISAHSALRDDFIRHFRNEARILYRLRHPNLPRVHDFFESGDHYYLVMDYIEGTTLEDAPAPDEALLIRWAAALCDVLSYLHGQSPPVLFRDLKPSNIMLVPDGSLRLIDFGIAKVFEPRKKGVTTTIMKGTVSHGYAAPEQYGSGSMDQRVDIYALGATLYFLLTRRVPPSSMELAAGQSDFVPLRAARPDLSNVLIRAVEGMMSLTLETRLGSVAAVRQALGLTRGAEVPKRATLECLTGLQEQLGQRFDDEPRQEDELTDADLEEAWNLLGRQAQKREIVRLALLCRRMDRPLVQYLGDRPELLVGSLESADRDQRLLASMALLNHGRQSQHSLLEYLSRSDNPQGRATALFLLHNLSHDMQAALIRRLVESGDEGEVLRLLRALQEARLPWESALHVLLHSASSAVRQQTARVLVQSDLPRQDKIDVLRHALTSGSPLVLVDTLSAIAELGSADMAPDVYRVLDRDKTSPVEVLAQVQACYTLARIGKPYEILPLLRGIIQSALYSAETGAWASEVRAAAVWAVGRQPTPQGTELLRSVLHHDRDAAVRVAARLALDNPHRTGLASSPGTRVQMEGMP